MVKARLDSTAYEGTFVARYFMGDHSEVGSTAKLDGGTLSFPVRYRDKDDIINFIKMDAAGLPPGGPPRSKDSSRVVSTGTGFMCHDDLIVTNYHFIHGGSFWEVVFPSTQQSYKLEVVVADKANDLAVLRLTPKEDGKKPAGRPLRVVDSQQARIGEEVYTIGFPLGDLLGSGHKAATGVLSATVGLEDDPRMFQLTVPAQPGNSGGPVLNASGQVIGVLASTLSVEYLYRKQQHLPQNVNFAIRSDYLLFLLRQVPKSSDMVPLDLSSFSRADQIARLQDSVGQIKTFK
jgi:serine protease Do